MNQEIPYVFARFFQMDTETPGAAEAQCARRRERETWGHGT
jgi:hypothetical protein